MSAWSGLPGRRPGRGPVCESRFAIRASRRNVAFAVDGVRLAAIGRRRCAADPFGLNDFRHFGAASGRAIV
jgi:hypothetical protein